MTAVAAPGRLRATGLAVVVAGAAAALGAASLVVPLPVLVAGVIALAGIGLVIVSPRTGMAAVAVFTVLRLPEVATEFHGAPSLFLPLLVLLALGMVVTRSAGRGGVAATVVIAAFAAVAAISLLTAPDATGVVTTLRGIAEDGSVAILAGVLLRGTASLRQVVWALVLAGGTIGLLAVAQFALGEYSTNFAGLAQWAVQNIAGTTDDVRISGPVGDPNFFAQWLVMLVPLAVDRAGEESAPSRRLVAAACALTMTAAVALSFSRGGILGLVVIAILGVARTRRPARVLGMALAAIGLAMLLAPQPYLDRLGALGDVGGVEAGIDPSVRARTAEITAALRMFSDDPMTGVGYGGFADHYVATVRDLGIDLRATPREAHNLYLQFAAEMGLPGIALLGAVIATVAWSIRRARRRFRGISDWRGDGIGAALAIGLIGYLVTSVFLHLAFARLPWLLVGIALALPGVAATEDADRQAATVRGAA